MLDTREPQSEIFRIARQPDAWQPPDWSRANSDGTFGNRFDDPEGYYRVLYAASQILSCFIETLARFRADFTLLAELSEIDGPDDFFPLGEVPREWRDGRLVGTAAAKGNYADVYGSGWVARLRRKLAADCVQLGIAADCVQLGIEDLDAGALQRGTPRRITQLASRDVFELGLPGIYYRSRYGHDLENWAIFEPFGQLRPIASQPIANDHPEFLKALEILGLRLTGR